VKLYCDTVQQADKGVDLEFLVGASGAPSHSAYTTLAPGVGIVRTVNGPAAVSFAAIHAAARWTSAAWAGSVLTLGIAANSFSSFKIRSCSDSRRASTGPRSVTCRHRWKEPGR